MVEIELDHSEEWDGEQDWQKLAAHAVAQAFAVAGFNADPRISVSISLSDNETVRGLNVLWRHKDKPTNVLSFPMLEADELKYLRQFRQNAGIEREILLGDIILAHGVCVAEAEEKAISLADHVTHLIIHGTLHLIGYDHIDQTDAEDMESLEVKALASLGLGNPYSDH
jgi:probable rRNA maturation factor